MADSVRDGAGKVVCREVGGVSAKLPVHRYGRS